MLFRPNANGHMGACTNSMLSPFQSIGSKKLHPTLPYLHVSCQVELTFELSHKDIKADSELSGLTCFAG